MTVHSPRPALAPGPLAVRPEPYPQHWVLDTVGRAQKSEIRNKSQIRNEENADESPRLAGIELEQEETEETEVCSASVISVFSVTSCSILSLDSPGILDFPPFEFVSDFGFREFELESGDSLFATATFLRECYGMVSVRRIAKDSVELRASTPTLKRVNTLRMVDTPPAEAGTPNP